MEYPNRVKDTTTTTGPGNITCDNVPPDTYVALGAKVAVGKKFPYGLFHRALNEWEIGIGTMLTATTFSRAPTDSSNGGALVNFSVGTKDLLCVVSGSEFAKLHRTDSAAFSTAVPLDTPGVTFMPQQSVGSALAFTVGASPVAGALAYVRLVADGTNAPTFTGMKEHGGSMGYDNRAGIVNTVQFFYDGADYWYSVAQANGATPVDNIAPTIVSAAVANSTPSVLRLTMSEAIDAAYPCAASAFAIGGHASAAGNVTISGTFVDVPLATPFVYGEAARTVSYTQPGTNNLRDAAGNLLGTTATPVAITNNVAAPATKPATMAAPVATAGQLSASIAFTAPANGGSAITGYTVTASTGQTATGTTSPIAITMPEGTAAFTITATNAIGTSDPSPASNSVTVSAAATVPAAPTIGTAVAGDGYVDVAYTANGDGGSAVLDATATLSTGETATGTTSPIRVTAANGTARTATVKVRNAVGSSAASAASNSVTPNAASTVEYLRLTSLVNVVESGTGPYTYTLATHSGVYDTPSNGQGGLSTKSRPANGDCYVTIVSTSPHADHFLGVTSGATGTKFTTMEYGMWEGQGASSVYTPVTSGSVGTATSFSRMQGDRQRFRFSGTSAIFEVARATAPNDYVVVHTWANVPGTAYKFAVNKANRADCEVFDTAEAVGLV